MGQASLDDLKTRMEQYAKEVGERDWLRSCKVSEQVTRQSLIEPFLDDVLCFKRHPKYVEREYKVSEEKNAKKVDYAIKREGIPVIFIEAKKCGDVLESGKILDQAALQVKKNPSVKFVALTNGIEWRWFSNNGSELLPKPFLVHNAILRTDDELPFLDAISKECLDRENLEKALDFAISAKSIEQKTKKYVDRYGKANTVRLDVKKNKKETLSRNARRCAWKPYKRNQKHWKIERNGKALMINVLRYLATQHNGGELDFFEKLEIYLGQMIDYIEDAKKIPEANKLYSNYILLDKGDLQSKLDFMIKAEELVVRRGNKSQTDPLFNVWLPVGKTKQKRKVDMIEENDD